MKKNALPGRSDLPKNQTWDLELIYQSGADWEQDFTKLDALQDEVAAFRGRLHESAETLRRAFEAIDALVRAAEKLYVFAHLRADEDTANAENRSRVERASARFAEISAATAWFEPEFLALDEGTLKKYLSCKELAFYSRSMNELLRGRQHTLTAAEETILGRLSDVLGSASHIYSTLNNADMTFPKVADEDGKKIELTHGNYIKFLESGDRKVRKRAFTAMFATYKKLRNTCAATLDGNIKKHAVAADIRHFDSSLAASLFSDNVPECVYNNLITAVHNHLPALHSYVKLRGKALKIKKMDMYDLYNPLRPSCKKEYTWDEAKKLVKAALKPLGEEYGKLLDTAFEERWVDIPECRGKRSGAYSSGCYDTRPYLLLNFHGTLNDVFTLAHELGHSMHSYYSNHTQEYHYADYSIFVAEVASTTNEILLQHYLLEHCKDKDLRAYLLCHLIDEIRGTVYRQTMFAEFELTLHQLAESGTPLTADLLEEKYGELNKSYYGKHIHPDELIKMEWARIPHFYYNFYVYKYATGMSAAMLLAQNILSGDAKKLNNYFGFLKAGSSQDVLDIMKSAGVDLSTPDAVNACLLTFAATVKELEELL